MSDTAAAEPWVPHAGTLHAVQLAEVVSVRDPDSRARVQVRLLGYDGVEAQDAPLWARVATSFAGSDYGAFLIPDVGDEVLVAFVGGDARFPVVVGSLWNGAAAPPDSVGGDGVDRWSLTGHAGTRVAIDESGQPTIAFSTPGGVTGTLTDEGGGKVEIVAGGNTITIEPAGVTVQAAAKVSVQAATVDVTAGMVKVDSALADFSGIVKCSVLQTNSVISPSYTPGAGNVW